MDAPQLTKPIPAQVINEKAAYGPFDLKQFISSQDGEASLQFSAELTDGSALPKGMICTADGILTGIPAKGTEGNYEIKLSIQNEAGALETSFVFLIKPSLAESGTAYTDELKNQVWEALEKNIPLPDLGELYDRPITALDIYYILERWGSLTIWDAFNFEPPGEKKLLQLEDASEHYNIYDRGSCLVAAPKDLFSFERTTADGLQSAQAIAREAFNRGWTVELAGFRKYTRAAWVQLQQLSELYGRPVDILNYNATPDDVKTYNNQEVGVKLKAK